MSSVANVISLNISVSSWKAYRLPQYLVGLTKVQGLIRGFLVRRRFLRYLVYLKAAICIQRHIKGHLTRKRNEPKCKDCLKFRTFFKKELTAVRQQLQELTKQQEYLVSTSYKYDKAFRYLFDQVASIQQQLGSGC